MKTLLTYLTILAAASTWAEGYFKGLGDLPGDIFYSSALAISSDGKVVVGQSAAAEGWIAFRWTESGGMQSLGDLPGAQGSSVAFDVSPDGSAVTGWTKINKTDREAFVWREGQGMTGIGDLPGGTFFSSGRGVTDGGTKVIGAASNVMGWEAFVWSSTGGMRGLGDLSGDNNTTVTAVSPDCSHYVGFGTTNNGTEAYLSKNLGYKQTLGDLPGGHFSSHANGLSPDGSIVVGDGVGINGTEAFIWTEATGMQGLGDLPGGSFGSSAGGVSADGKTIVGYGNGEAGYRAVIWDETRTPHDLNTFLPDHGISIDGWVLDGVVAITPDGKYLIGSGTNPDGEYEAWIAFLGGESNGFDALWGDCDHHPDDWHASDWYGWFNAVYYPLMWHAEHGWQTCSGGSPQSVMFYDHGLQVWTWTSSTSYPFIYRFGDQPGWLFYFKGCQPGERWFYDYTIGNHINEASI
ncbi:MAG: PEP-CTERM sorting domain-containing protein [Puniceicoccaceae bacterium]